MIVETKDDTKEDAYAAAGLSVYSNSKSIVVSYASIFESLWKQTELYQQLKIYDKMQKEFINMEEMKCEICHGEVIPTFDCRNPYSKIASIVGMTPNAVKERVNKMVSNGTIRSFVLRINPTVLGYEKGCILIIRDIDKTAKEQDIINKINLIGDIHTYAKELGRASLFLLAVRAGAEDKIVILTDMLKPAAVESIFVSYRPLTMEIRNSDLQVIKCLLSDPRMLVEDIARNFTISKDHIQKIRKDGRKPYSRFYYFKKPIVYTTCRIH